jgi:large repetitive protein
MTNSKHVPILSLLTFAASFAAFGLVSGCQGSASTGTSLATQTQASTGNTTTGTGPTIITGTITGSTTGTTTNIPTTASASTITITPATQTIGTNANLQFSASGGTPPYMYTIESGGGSINSTGIYVAPSMPDAMVEITVEDANANVATAMITVASTGLSLSAASTNLNSSVETDQMTATGGIQPYTFAVVSGGGTITASTGLYTSPSVLPSSTTSVELSTTDSAGSVAFTFITVGPSASTTTTATTNPNLLLFTQALSNNILTGWPVTNVLADNPGTCYSSNVFTSSAPPTAPFLATYFSALTTVTQINLLARVVDGAVLGFPAAYQLYVTNTANTSWISIGNSSVQPNSAGGLTVTLSQSVPTWGFLIIATSIGLDNTGNHYFQLCGVSAE